MNSSVIQEFAEITGRLIGDIDIIASDAVPNPWFSKDIFRKKDLQWAGYIGDFSHQENALVFGINLEFIPAWRRVYPKIAGDLPYFSSLLQKHKNFEWHWLGRPVQRVPNPPMEFLSRRNGLWTFQVKFKKWLNELDDILSERKLWSGSSPMRPQIQIMRFIGTAEQIADVSLVRQNLEQTILDLEPVVTFLK